MEEEFLKQYQILFIKGKEDFVAAKYLYDGFENHNLELNLEIIFFHFQQAVEKFLKTVIDYNGIRFPRTHDIGDLVSLIRDNNITVLLDIESFISLSNYAVEGRYSIIHDDIDDVGKYIISVDNLLKFVESTIKEVSNE